MRASLILTWIFFALILFVIVGSLQYNVRARFGPLLIGIPTAILLAVQLVREYFHKGQKPKQRQSHIAEEESEIKSLKGKPLLLASRDIALCVISLLAAIYLFGLLIGYALFIVGYLKVRHEGWLLSLGLGLGLPAVLVYGIFHMAMKLVYYRGIIFEALGWYW